jgi:ABC-2 type transport system permease protein
LTQGELESDLSKVSTLENELQIIEPKLEEAQAVEEESAFTLEGAEERKSGTIELLMTLPITPLQAVLGKFLAAWAFAGIALALTFPIWITVNYLGDPDNGAIFAAYIGSLLMAGGFLAIGSCLSAVTRNQVIAFIVTVVVCFCFLLAGMPLVLDIFSGWAPQLVVDGIASLSFLTHFNAISQGVIDLRDLVYFVLLIAAFLYANTIVLAWKQAD